ncbi:MAG: class I SAM-dependent RNA methyltransferase [Nitrospiraceae bacterium]|nr:class I SAM-dependent RNA methyltransferase [Nitrospiraceae bacterium]
MIRVKAETPVYGGYVIARNDGVIFVKGALPGETIDAEVIEKRKDYSIALAREVIEPSSFRVEPECPYFGLCGGCHLQHIAYDEQVSMKSAIISDSMRRIAGVEITPGVPLAGNNFHYRQRAQFKVSGAGKIGFYKEGTREIVDIRACPLMTESINSMLAKLRGLSTDGVREIHVTDSGSGLAAFIKGKGFDENFAEEYINAGFESVVFDDGSFRGRGYVTFDLSGLKYTVSPWSFFQSNWPLNCVVAETVKSVLEPLEDENILDLYAGGGNFSILLSDRAGKITAVEESAASVKDGIRNLELNGIKNMKFARSPIEKFFPPKGGKFDTVIVDPPRPGLTKDAMNRLLETEAKRILYISCNPTTLARDIKRLSSSYRLEWIRPVDFFPNTYHIEALCLLARL